jgi:3-methyl-2-oxobutanoate hydroxymethyltransferase
MNQKVTIPKLKRMKREGIPISMVTAYDYPSAKLVEEAGVDVILVGDSLGNVVLGYDSTIPVTMDDMVYHSRAVARAVNRCLVVTDMPFLTYHGSLDTTLANVTRVMQEGRANAVKMEGGAEIAATVEACVKAGVPVLGHIGLTPQSVNQIGGYRVQGKLPEEAERLIADAKALEQSGAFGIVLELVTEEIASYITKEISIPTIGIGAGRNCDGQVLVFHDILRYSSQDHPKRFVKSYADIGSEIRSGISRYVQEVKSRAFPEESHAFKGDEELYQYLYGHRTEPGTGRSDAAQSETASE